MDAYSRRNGMYVYDGLDCRPISYSELCDDQAFDPSNIGDDPKFLSWILPVSSRGSPFKGKSYVLGFDYGSRTLFVRQFHWIPGRIDDIWCVWDEGFTVYRLTIPDLIEVLDSVLSGTADVSRGILSYHSHCMIPRSGDDPGLEIVITILLCQWVVDFAAVFSGMDTAACDQFTKTLTTYMEDCRLILQRASYRAWFASRDGHTMRDYSRKAAIDKYTNDLYTFSQSAESGSLNGKSWHAPGLNTCSMLRRRDRYVRRERAEWKLEGLFARRAAALPAESSEQVFEKMLARFEEDAQPAFKLEPPRTPPPRPLHDAQVPRDSSGTQSPEIVSAAAEPLFIETTDFQKIPLTLLLERFLELVETYPGLDTPGHRRRFGGLLAEMGIDIEQASMEDNSTGLSLENQAGRWTYSEAGSFGGSPRAFAGPGLLPSPLLD
ncbi:hypothetical protein P170DRAFT_441484 [Aspergillus steynii IBT 23096]|uniref:Uncharacterized protein n=1 Tax=Aspergillus steynii IBT 23096 TaxID=1392250 RepID=A0A2I2FTS9_9EURO|nr:uncharacterized protein P170DRAFT_441484 [Aspergillus steynii IBT 23096]PLB44039.1 hypothetical protein P170DRAFT_441484 [Aspergillus steynii IBT 23096]